MVGRGLFRTSRVAFPIAYVPFSRLLRPSHPLQRVGRNHRVPAVAPAYSGRSCDAQGRG